MDTALVGVGTGATILVVDDESKARHGLAKLLRGRNYNVRVAASGNRALQEAARIGRGLWMALFDIRLGGQIDGIDAAQELQLRYPKVRKVFVTAYSDNADYRRRASEARLEIVEWIEKPVIGEAGERLLRRVDEEMWRMQLDYLNELSGTYGLHVYDAINLAKEMARQLGNDTTVHKWDEFQSRMRSGRAVEVIEKAEAAIAMLTDSFMDLSQRQLEYAILKDILLGSLWRVFSDYDKGHRQLVVLIRMAFRKLSALSLTEQHIEAISRCLRILKQATVNADDVAVCKAILRRSGLEPLAEFGDRLGELQQIYDYPDEE